MTRSILFISLMLYSFATSAQPYNVTISGRGKFQDSIVILTRNIGYLGLTEQSDTIRVNKKHHFITRLNISEPEHVYVTFGSDQLELLLIPNSSVVLYLKDSTSQITGLGSDYARYFLKKQTYFKKLYHEYSHKHPGYDEGTSLHSDQYFVIQDSITQKQFNFLNSFFTTKSSPYKRQFIDQERISILYSNLFYKIAFDGSDIRKFKYFQDKLKIYSTYTYKFSDQLTMDDIRVLSDVYYQNFVTTVIGDLARQKIKKQGQSFNIEAYIDNAMAAIDTLSLNKVCNLANKTIVLNAVVEDIQRRKKIEWSAKLYKTLATLSSADPNHVLLNIKNKLDAAVRNTKFIKGAIAPDFTLTDLLGNVYNLGDFKGKKVYMDLWAIWCPHCIELADDWNKLVKSYKRNPKIAFLSVSLDDKAEVWREYIKKHHLEGILVNAGAGGLGGIFGKTYDIQYLPHFILLDEDGKMAAYDAPRPDTPGLLKQLFNNEH